MEDDTLTADITADGEEGAVSAERGTAACTADILD
jgi:hypothetical protein